MLTILGPWITVFALIAFGATLVRSTRHLNRSHGRTEENYLGIAVSMFGWACCLGGVFALFYTFSGALAMVFAVLLTIAGTMFLTQYLDSRRYDLLAALAIGTRHEIPIQVSVNAFLQDQPRFLQNRYARLAECLEQGMTLPKAMNASRVGYYDTEYLLLEYGTRTSLLPDCLNTIGQAQLEAARSWRPILEKLIYILVVCFLVLSSVTNLVVTLAPALSDMLEENLEMGAADRLWTYRFLTRVEQFPPVWIGVIAGALGLFLLGFGLIVGMYYLGWMKTDYPLLRRFRKVHESSMILRCLAVGVRNQRDPNVMLKIISHEHPSGRIRRRLKKKLDATGGDYVTALTLLGLLTTREAAWLQVSHRAGHLAQTLEEVAQAKVCRHQVRIQALSDVLMPAFILAIGGYVLFAGVLIFSVLFQIAESTV